VPRRFKAALSVHSLAVVASETEFNFLSLTVKQARNLNVNLPTPTLANINFRPVNAYGFTMTLYLKCRNEAKKAFESKGKFAALQHVSRVGGWDDERELRVRLSEIICNPLMRSSRVFISREFYLSHLTIEWRLEQPRQLFLLHNAGKSWKFQRNGRHKSFQLRARRLRNS